MHLLKAPLLGLILIAPLCFGIAAPTSTTRVAADTFVRAESDKFFSRVMARGGFGKFVHNRELTPVETQVVIRPNRDTLYSSAVFDLEAGPVTVTLPDAGQRYFSLIAINEDQYTQPLMYKPGSYHFTRESIGTRYVLLGVRTLADPASADDMKSARALQDEIKVDQPGGAGRFDSVYNAAGYFERNAQDIYTLNNLTAKRERDGSIAVQFGGCDNGVANCLPVMPGWNYMVRLYKPHANVVDGSWHFPEATPAG